MHNILPAEAGQGACPQPVRRSYTRSLNIDLIIFQADLLINGGELERAGQLIAEQLTQHPDCLALLLRLGLIDEKNGQYLNAFDLYRQLEKMAVTPAEQNNVREALKRVSGHVSCTEKHGARSFALTLSGNEAPLQLCYNLPRQKLRREMFLAILETIDSRAGTVLEVECDTGLVSRNLSVHGFEVEATSAEMADTLLAIGFESVEMLGGMASSNLPSYYHLDINAGVVGQLGMSDVIMVLPYSRAWYYRHGVGEAARLLKKLAGKASRQFYFYLPAPENGDDDRQLLENLGCDGGDKVSFGVLHPCFTAEDGGVLYRIDKKQVLPNSYAKLLPRGLEADGRRNAVFEVETALCRSENGFAYTGPGWSHHRASLAELIEKPGKAYRKSILKRFYSSFQPKNRYEQLFGALTGPGFKQESLAPLNRGMVPLPWSLPAEQSGLETSAPVLEGRYSDSSSHYGPYGAVCGRRELEMLKQTFDLMEKHGYLPEVYPDGYIRGTLLKNGSDYRFLVAGGTHRLAAMGQLGIGTFKARFAPGALPVADLQQLEQWPLVKTGYYDQAVAEKVFRYYFEEDGRRRAQQLGI